MTGNLAEVIVATAKARPDLRIGILGDELRLDDALALAAGRAVEMLDSGLSPGDRVAMIAHNSTDYIVTWLGSLLAGTPVALVNPTYPAALIEEMLDPLVPQVVMDHHAIMAAGPPIGSRPSGASRALRSRLMRWCPICTHRGRAGCRSSALRAGRTSYASPA